MELGTCTERLAALGLDFGDTGSLRVATSQYARDRKRVYDGMGSGVRSAGLTLGGVVTQGLAQKDLFRITRDARSGRVLITPILHALEVPVRAMITPLRDQAVAGKIRDAVRQLLMPVLPEGSIWLQDWNLYHATLYHASSHVKPVHASEEVIAEEERAIKGVCSRTCPINAVLDRVVVTPTGVVVACWQVLAGGGEPAVLRADLGRALPNAPPRSAQMVKEPAMLHTTIARLLQPPTPGQEGAATSTGGSTALSGTASGGAGSSGGGAGRELRAAAGGGEAGGRGSQSGRRRLQAAERAESSSGGSADVEAIDDAVVVRAVDLLSATLCGLRAQFGEVWFIEEQDLLALALNGRYVRHLAPLSCEAAGGGGGGGDVAQEVAGGAGTGGGAAAAA